MSLSTRAALILIPCLSLAVNISMSQTWRDLLYRADSLAQSGRMDSAIHVGWQVLENPQSAVSSNDTAIATVLLRLAMRYREHEVFDLAETCYESCTQIRINVLGSEHVAVAKALNGQAILMWQLGRYDESERLNQEALAIRERLLGKDHLDVSESLTNLGLVFLDQRRYKEGQDLLTRALVIERKNHGNHSLSVAQSQLNLGNAYYVQADYNHAEEYYKRALETRERLLGKQHPLVAQLYDNLGNCYYDQGRMADAETLYKQALAILQNSSSAGKRDLAICLQNLGILYTDTRQYDLAENYLFQALDLRKSVFPDENAEVAVSYANLADLMVRRKRYAEAESLYLRALPICSEHERLALTNVLADLYTDIGRYAVAESLYAYLETQWHRSSTAAHPQRADFLGSYAWYFRHRNNPVKSEFYARSALRMWKDMFATGASVMSERDALAYSTYTGSALSYYLSCTFLNNGRFLETTHLPDMILSSKGVVSDLVFERRRRQYDVADSLSSVLENRLMAARRTLMRFYSGETEIESPQAYKRTVDSLNAVSNKLESQIARRSAGFRRHKDHHNVTARRVAAGLPAQATLVEYLRWEYFDFKTDTDTDHYLVAVIPHNGQPLIRDLGEAEKIDRVIKRYRKHLVDLSEKLSKSGLPLTDQDQIEYTSVASELYKLLWQPIAAQIRGTGLVFIAPDAGLNLVSFGGLIDEKRQYLVENHQLHYLSAGRDLIRLKDQDITGSGLLAFGDPDYDAPVAERTGRGSEVPVNPSALTEQSNVNNIRSACGNLREITVGRLPNTRQEVESIAGYWKQDYHTESAVIYTDTRASEENFKANSEGKRVIHLATHGYFIQNECLPKQQGKSVGHGIPHTGENPLLLSGLFLAGANLHGAGTEDMQREDGIVTALEVSSMDFRGVELVTLSACETALGEVRQGEGVYGLRRAFQVAGARTVVSALWRVPDSETKSLMKAFYAQKGTTYPELIQKVALQHIHDLRLIGRPTHPYSWGGFIVTGDWRRK
jgi:CHAT domain-containing protein/tetratricopeptide (TPR) repeat protein